jgi:Chaperone of endosialidase
MKPLIRLKETTPLFVIVLLAACLGPSPLARAVVPAPDGGYPGFNTAEGENALLSLTSGLGNTGVGWYALSSNTDASFNTGVGGGALALNNADSNTAIGTAAMLLNTSGAENTAVGTTALLYNDSGNSNNAVGAFALHDNIDGDGNIAFGAGALFKNIHASFNTAIGAQALFFNDVTGNNLAQSNTAVGASALNSNTDGDSNTAVGDRALFSSTGNGNTALGAGAGNSVITANNVIAIGTGGANVSFGCYIGNIWKQSGGSQAVYVNSDGKLGAQVSSCRFKDEIKPMEEASQVIYSLKPVSFRYKREVEPMRQVGFGLIAEEVTKISSDLVTRGSDGKVISVRYDAVNAMLLNEFLKEHRKNEKQEATIARLQRQIEALSADLQQVTTQAEMNRVIANIAHNNQ